eukprot:TRINITY_DN1470_c0_g1_i8.p1 TRINITY_DN1470_c0_g1~~TRINITY_DN1470_c0_g1_i8.p1  ORF type:complete len:124 (-),score=17.84 TRINITY_DN1470_c0_g1_i8:20-391(-)
MILSYGGFTAVSCFSCLTPPTEIGHEMFFVNAGAVEIIAENGEKIRSVGVGGFFGEMALVFEEPRAASGVARTFCELSVLEKSAFDLIMKQYPDLYQRILGIAQRRKGERKTGAGSSAPAEPH